MNKIEVLIFGQLKEISKQDHLILENIQDTDTLQNELTKLYPKLNSMSYRVAVNKSVITENTSLPNETKVALLPPFSGG